MGPTPKDTHFWACRIDPKLGSALQTLNWAVETLDWGLPVCGLPRAACCGSTSLLPPTPPISLGEPGEEWDLTPSVMEIIQRGKFDSQRISF